MTTAVYFYYYIAIRAIKINDIITDDFLTIKVITFELPVFYLIPKKYLREVSCFAQFPCSFF